MPSKKNIILSQTSVNWKWAENGGVQLNETGQLKAENKNGSGFLRWEKIGEIGHFFIVVRVYTLHFDIKLGQVLSEILYIWRLSKPGFQKWPIFLITIDYKLDDEATMCLVKTSFLDGF